MIIVLQRGKMIFKVLDTLIHSFTTLDRDMSHMYTVPASQDSYSLGRKYHIIISLKRMFGNVDVFQHKIIAVCHTKCFRCSFAYIPCTGAKKLVMSDIGIVKAHGWHIHVPLGTPKW